MLMNARTLLMTFTAVAMVVYVVRRMRWLLGRMKTARSVQNRDNAEVPATAALGSTTQRRFAEPTQCVLWDDPKLVRGTRMKELFELIDTYADESHLKRYLLKCRECGQLYFFEFYEWVDWENGNDPQYSKYIPISNLDDAEMLKNAEPHDLLRFSPSLNIDFPKDAEAPTMYWAGKVPSRPLPAPDASLSGAGSETEKKNLWRRLFSR
jgi:hypothetical protein